MSQFSSQVEDEDAPEDGKDWEGGEQQGASRHHLSRQQPQQEVRRCVFWQANRRIMNYNIPDFSFAGRNHNISTVLANPTRACDAGEAGEADKKVMTFDILVEKCPLQIISNWFGK